MLNSFPFGEFSLKLCKSILVLLIVHVVHLVLEASFDILQHPPVSCTLTGDLMLSLLDLEVDIVPSIPDPVVILDPRIICLQLLNIAFYFCLKIVGFLDISQQGADRIIHLAHVGHTF